MHTPRPAHTSTWFCVSTPPLAWVSSASCNERKKEEVRGAIARGPGLKGNQLVQGSVMMSFPPGYADLSLLVFLVTYFSARSELGPPE